jgi:hypothetical protein
VASRRSAFTLLPAVNTALVDLASVRPAPSCASLLLGQDWLSTEGAAGGTTIHLANDAAVPRGSTLASPPGLSRAALGTSAMSMMEDLIPNTAVRRIPPDSSGRAASARWFGSEALR